MLKQTEFFIYLSTIIFLFGAVAWKAENILNLFVKVILWLMTICGVVLSLKFLHLI